MAMAGLTNLKLSLFPNSFAVSSTRKPFLVSTSIFPTTSHRFPKIFAFSSNDIKVGSNIEVDGAPCKVIEFLHVKPGKGAAFVRTTLRNYVTGNSVEKTFRAGSKMTYQRESKCSRRFCMYNSWQLMDFGFDKSFMLTARLMVLVSEQSAKMLCRDYCDCDH